MSLDSDVIVDRRRIRRKLTFWRVIAALGVIAAAVAVGVLASPSARTAISGSTVTSCVMVSSACRIFGSVIRFMCGQRLHGRTKSTSGWAVATLSLIEHSVTMTTRLGRLPST